MSDKLNKVLENIKQQKTDRHYGPSVIKKNKKTLRKPQQGFFRGLQTSGKGV